MKWIIKLKFALLISFSAMLLTVAGVGPVLVEASTGKSNASPVTIQAVQMRGIGATAELVIVASTPATYTSYKTSSPHRLVVDFSQAVPLDSLSEFHFKGGPVKSVTLKRFDTDAGVLTRMEVFLVQDIEPIITPSVEKHGELRISFPGFKPEALTQVTQKDLPTASQDVQPVKANSAKEVLETTNANISAPVVTDVVVADGMISIVTQNPVKEFKTFRLNKPERVVVDIVNAKNSMLNKIVQLNASGVSTARVGSYSDKVRVVFDSINASLPEATFEKSSKGLNVIFATAAGSEKKSPVTPLAPVGNAVPAAVDHQVVVGSSQSPAVQAVAQISAIDFQVLNDISRVTIKATGNPVIVDPVKSAGSISLLIKNAQLPRSLQRSLEAREFASPVLRVTPVQIKAKNSTDVLVRISMKMDALFELRREADVVYLEVKHPATMQKTLDLAKKTSAQKASASNVGDAPVDDQLFKAAEAPVGVKTKYMGRKITLEFADAEVRKIFQLLSEVSNKNFVLGDEVTGTVSLKLVNVPWDQALDVIMETKGLDKREDGTIILIRAKGKFKSILDEEMEVRKAAIKSEPLDTRIFEVNYADLGGIVSQFSALKTERGVITSDARTNKIIVKDVKSALVDMGKILKNLDVPEKQVMIEARIVEASSDFSRSLGVSWSVDKELNAKRLVQSVDSVFGGIASTPGTSTIGSTTGAADITFGTIGANVKLSMRLNAAAKVGLIRIISSPKVATLNNKSAKITQGKQIPYVSATSDKVETKFVEAALSLEVTPHINNNGTIVLKVDAKNDAPDTTSTSTTPAINKKQATTEMLLRDGETTVIGGIFVDSETEGEEGVPWLMSVPILGNIFKSTTYLKGKSELLIFITPRILETTI